LVCRPRTTHLDLNDLQVTRLGFGAWTIGGTGYEFVWGEQDDDESLAAIELDLGVN
jgi:aryl-alcohol dehydrogenase-like predicted oxidoreductase